MWASGWAVERLVWLHLSLLSSLLHQALEAPLPGQATLWGHGTQPKGAADVEVIVPPCDEAGMESEYARAQRSRGPAGRKGRLV